jgi:transcriptional regulator with XRE-family HTH domain
MITAVNVGPVTLKTVGKQVRKYRQLAGLTQGILAERCGIYRTYLSRIEHGDANPTLSVLSGLSVALEVELKELVCETIP